MNKIRIYACYRKYFEPSNDDIIEFWSTNKKLYDMYVSIYGKYLTSDKYYHVVLPSTQYEHFYNNHLMDMLDVFNHVPWYNSGKNMFISTMQLSEILDPDETMAILLCIRHEFVDMIKLLPANIRNPICRTKVFDFIIDPMKTDYINGLDVDLDKFQYLMHANYYSEKDIMDITGI